MGTKMHWVKGVLALLLASGLALWCSFLWNQTFQPEPENSATASSNFVAAYTENSEAQSATFWFNLRPPRPTDKNQLGEIWFSFDLKGAAATQTSAKFALAGTLGQLLSDCQDPNVRIKRGRSFDELPAPAKLAIQEVATRGESDGQQPTGQLLDVAEVSRLVHQNTYTEVEIPVLPKLGGIDTEPNTVGVSVTQICHVIDGQEMWNSLNGQPRIIAPAVGAAAPLKVKKVTLYPVITVFTDDLFFLLHSTDEPVQFRGMTELRNLRSVVYAKQGYNVAASGLTSGTFSGARLEANEKNVTLLLGVLLGAVASILIALLSSMFDYLNGKGALVGTLKKAVAGKGSTSNSATRPGMENDEK